MLPLSNEAAASPVPEAAAASALQRFARRASRAAEAEQERCEFCAEPLPATHRHLLEVAARELKCVCRACALLFDREAASAGRYRLVPDRRRFLTDFQMSAAEWESLRIPVGIAFLVRDTAAGGETVAFYPGPMGITEALPLPAGDWEALARRHPALRQMQPDVEALLAYRARGARQYFLVPIDECYRLAGRIRLYWRGLSGGPAVWREVDQFFAGLRGRCSVAAAAEGEAGA